jgi:hypothetical protein
MGNGPRSLCWVQRYHSPMRRIVLMLMLMLILLPLRGWTADAMGSGLLMPMNPMLLATQAEANTHDCMGHDTREAAAAPSDDACATFSLCQICHTVALSIALEYRPVNSQAFALPRAASHHFVNAEAALSIKPPIS